MVRHLCRCYIALPPFRYHFASASISKEEDEVGEVFASSTMTSEFEEEVGEVFCVNMHTQILEQSLRSMA